MESVTIAEKDTVSWKLVANSRERHWESQFESYVESCRNRLWRVLHRWPPPLDIWQNTHRLKKATIWQNTSMQCRGWKGLKSWKSPKRANRKAEWHSKGNREEADPGEVCGDPDTDTDTDTVTDSKTNTTITFKRKSCISGWSWWCWPRKEMQIRVLQLWTENTGSWKVEGWNIFLKM